MRKITLSVSLTGLDEEIVFCQDFEPADFYGDFGPIHDSDCFWPGDMPPKVIETILHKREDLKDRLACEIAELIDSALSKRDTFNGYRIQKES
jgi:hypothetical protein